MYSTRLFSSSNNKFIPGWLILTCLLLVQYANCDPSSEAAEQQEAEPQFDPTFIKRELKNLIITRVDHDKDGSISYEELKTYLADLHTKNVKYNVDKQWILYAPQIHEVFSWEGYEPERVEVLTWDHYFNQTYPELIGIDLGIPMIREQDTARILDQTQSKKDSDGLDSKKSDSKASDESADDPHFASLKLMALRADQRWKLADENGDTLLTKSEFEMLLHPDEGHEALQDLFVKEASEDMDSDGDGKICLEEFMTHLKLLANEHERDDPNWLSSQQDNFGRFLDINKDGSLDAEEMKNWLVPSKSQKFESEAKRLFDIGDTNEDHKLTTAEIMEQYEQYVNLIPSEVWDSQTIIQSDESNTTSDQHDEL